jgi:Peptidoglycan-synthase activator LpoB
MIRSKPLTCLFAFTCTSLFLNVQLGCRGYQYGHLLKNNQSDMVGSHAAGSEVYNPLVEEAVGRLLSSCESTPVVSDDPNGMPGSRKICFVGVENKSAEELADFKDQIYQMIDAQINRSGQFEAVSRRMVDSALIETRLRPDSLLVPGNMQLFSSVLQRQGQPIDYLLYATLTSGTTERNSSSQRNYLLTMELVDTRTGSYKKEQAEIRKGYHKSPFGKLANYSLWPKAGR